MIIFRGVNRSVNRFGRFLEILGEIAFLTLQVINSAVRLRFHYRNTIDQIIRIGIDSLPIAITTAIFVGMVFATQIVKEFTAFGASSMIGGVMGIALWRELIPLLTAVVIAGRIGAAISAEIGTMKVTEQIEALEAMSQEPVSFLVTPRVIAAMLTLPLLVGFGDVVGFFSGFAIAITHNVNPASYFDSADSMLRTFDITGGIIKSLVFGFCIGIIGCYMGLSTTSGAKGVGEYTTKAVVYSLITIFIVNYLLSVAIFQ